MKRIVSPHDMQDIDRKAIQNYGIPGEKLMDNAGRAVYEFIIQHYSGLLDQGIYVFCGKGNNGGDGFVIARYLIQHGYQPEIFVCASIPDIKYDSLLNFNRLVATGNTIHFIENNLSLIPQDAPALVIDALLGTGNKGDLSGSFYEIVTLINRWKKNYKTRVISVDIPSGLNGETGYAGNIAVEADVTITMGLPKKGLIFGNGKVSTGQLVIADIGIPEALCGGGDMALVEKPDITLLLKPRPQDTYKYNFGKVAVIAGSKGMSGAALLTAQAIMRSGAGMLKVGTPGSISHVIENQLPEALPVTLAETDAGTISLKALDKIIELLSWCDVLALGPGISRHEETQQVVEEIIKCFPKPAVIDADAIFALSQKIELIRNSPANLVFTPHLGEFSTLTGIPVATIKENKIEILQQHAKRFKQTILLKGSPTLVASHTGTIKVSNTGNPGMATAGSGDVLTGIAAGLIAQDIPPEQAAWAGAYIHGLCGDLAKQEFNELSLMAGDLIHFLPKALKIVLE
jgi:ADP-dependent NAD(P)H-hydrate dehydratase / NAD(P)H-hydrate epimerase